MLRPRSSLLTIAALLCFVNANHYISLNNRPRHRRIIVHSLFASPKKNYDLNDNNNNIPVDLSSVFGVRGGADDLVQENPEYEPPKEKDDSGDDDSDSSSDGSDSEEGEIDGDESSDEELIDDVDEDDDEEKEGDISSSKSTQSKYNIIHIQIQIIQTKVKKHQQTPLQPLETQPIQYLHSTCNHCIPQRYLSLLYSI